MRRGVGRFWFLPLVWLLCALPVAAQQLPVLDGAALFTAGEREELTQQTQQLSTRLGVQLMVATTRDTQGKEIRLWAADTFEEQFGVGTTGLVMAVDMGERQAAVVALSGMVDYFPVESTDYLCDQVLLHLGKGEYLQSAQAFLSLAQQGIEGYGAGDGAQLAYRFGQPEGGVGWGVALGVGAAVSGAVCWGLYLSHPSLKRQKGSARNYLAARHQGEEGLQLTYRDDRFVRSHTSRTRRQENTNKGGSSGGGFTSSGGSRASGSSGSF